jgi:hypothetical protein
MTSPSSIIIHINDIIIIWMESPQLIIMQNSHRPLAPVSPQPQPPAPSTQVLLLTMSTVACSHEGITTLLVQIS